MRPASRTTGTIYDAARRYAAEGVPLLVVAGKEYGSGSSRDWAAMGTALLGVCAVLAASFERIHQSNLIGMGVLPLQFAPGEDAASLGLTGEEAYAVRGLAGEVPRTVTVTASGPGGTREFAVTARIDTPAEAAYYRHGGILPYVLRQPRRLLELAALRPAVPPVPACPVPWTAAEPARNRQLILTSGIVKIITLEYNDAGPRYSGAGIPTRAGHGRSSRSRRNAACMPP